MGEPLRLPSLVVSSVVQRHQTPTRTLPHGFSNPNLKPTMAVRKIVVPVLPATYFGIQPQTVKPATTQGQMGLPEIRTPFLEARARGIITYCPCMETRTMASWLGTTPTLYRSLLGVRSSARYRCEKISNCYRVGGVSNLLGGLGIFCAVSTSQLCEKHTLMPLLRLRPLTSATPN